MSGRAWTIRRVRVERLHITHHEERYGPYWRDSPVQWLVMVECRNGVDLLGRVGKGAGEGATCLAQAGDGAVVMAFAVSETVAHGVEGEKRRQDQIGRASCRERV